jgi:hypothetical protein
MDSCRPSPVGSAAGRPAGRSGHGAAEKKVQTVHNVQSRAVSDAPSTT